MARGLFAGMTDYSHQSLQDIIEDLDDWKANLVSTSKYIQAVVKKLQDNSYWSKVPADMKSLVAYSLKFFETSITEIDEISQNLEMEVQQHHIARLRNLADTAQELSQEFGIVWHQKYDLKDYGNPDFSIMERIYRQGRGMVIDMIDLSNVAARLETFLGMKREKDDQEKTDRFPITILLIVISTIVAIVSNVASGILPSAWQPYLWLSWPLLGILIFLFIILSIKQ